MTDDIFALPVPLTAPEASDEPATPQPAEFTLPAVPVRVPRIEGRFSVGLPDRPLTYEEAAEAINRLHDYVRDRDEYDAAFRWHVGRVYRALPEADTNRARRTLDLLREQHNVWRQPSWLYDCVSLFDTFRTQDKLIGKVRQMKDGNGYSWSKLRDDALRPERVAEDDGASLEDQAVHLIDSGVQDFRSAEEKLEKGRAMLPADHPYRETADAVVEEAREHLAAEAKGLLAEARAADERGPWRSEDYRRFVKGFACPWTGDTVVDFAHTGRNRGMAEKATDASGVPQQHDLHMGLHRGDARALALLAEGPTEAEVVASLLTYWVTGRNDGPVRLVPSGEAVVA